MSVVHNADIAKSGLVFNVDANSPQCTRHNVHPYPTNLWKWISVNALTTGVRCTISPAYGEKSPVGDMPIKMSCTGQADPYISTYSASKWNLAPAQLGQVWRLSVYVKPTINTTFQPFLMEANSSGTYLAGSNTIFNIEAGKWNRVTISRTLNNASCAYVQCRLDGPETTTCDILIDGVQMERVETTGDPATPLVDIGYDNLIHDLSYEQNHSQVQSSVPILVNTPQGRAFKYDDSYITSHVFFLSTPVNHDSFTISFCARGTRTPVSDFRKFVVLADTNNIAFLHVDSRTVAAQHMLAYVKDFALSVWVSIIMEPQVTYTDYEFHAYEYVIDNSTVTAYRDGVQTGTISLSSIDLSGYGAIERIKLNDTGSMQGQVQYFRMYNRPLNAAEVKQNYAAVKGRLGHV